MKAQDLLLSIGYKDVINHLSGSYKTANQCKAHVWLPDKHDTDLCQIGL